MILEPSLRVHSSPETAAVSSKLRLARHCRTCIDKFPFLLATLSAAYYELLSTLPLRTAPTKWSSSLSDSAQCGPLQQGAF